MTNSQPYCLESYSDGEDAVDSAAEQAKSKFVDPKKVLRLYHSRLTDFERNEILQYDQVRFCSNQSAKVLFKTFHLLSNNRSTTLAI